jgi:hypothetical protein
MLISYVKVIERIGGKVAPGEGKLMEHESCVRPTIIVPALRWEHNPVTFHDDVTIYGTIWWSSTLRNILDTMALCEKKGSGLVTLQNILKNKEHKKQSKVKLSP